MVDRACIWRISEMHYGPRDIATGVTAATGQKLEAVARGGFTGIWAYARLREVSRTGVFGQLSDGAV